MTTDTEPSPTDPAKESAPAIEPTPASPTNNKRKNSTSSAEENDDVAAPSRSTKRERKSVQRLEAAYTASASQKPKEIAIGRGVPLGTMEHVAEQIKAAKMKGSELATAHNFCFGGRGKDRLKKTQLLEFSGYLPPKEKGASASKQKELDEPLEEKFTAKANKMTIAGLKQMCDFFDIDRTHKSGKEDLVKCLLHFIGCPNEKLTKTYIKTSKTTTVKKQKKKKRGGDDDDDDDDAEGMEIIDGKSVPTDSALRKWVRAYISCFNLEKVTTKHALDTCANKFGVSHKDMAATGKKKVLKGMLTEEMSLK
eukprot:CAMPEP_0194199668 /NCGR_PEP_ID=MMETSP0156-20130528/602_1 /TAXON_ID=33649 /ORGANISM="Thalassionema nitzschioides, Strain L26-B" /LENGTH=308 /DNA_ID=CAMNT_0038924603 /DNA_START=13 /DNA_END=939 /DNA_ORIENTATION=+